MDEAKTAEKILKKKRITEYLVVSDKDSKVILSSPFYHIVKRQAKLIRDAGGQVTVFKSLEA